MPWPQRVLTCASANIHCHVTSFACACHSYQICELCLFLVLPVTLEVVCCILACSSFHEENVTSQVGQRLPQRVHGLLRCRDSQCGFSELVNSWLVALLDSLFVLASVVTWQIPLLTATFGSCTFLFELGLGDHTRLWCNSFCAVFNLKFDSLMHWASRCWLNLSRWVHLISGDWIWKRLVTCFWCYYCAVTVFDFLVILSWHCLVKPPWHDLWIQFVRHYHGPPSGDQHWQSGGFALRGVWGRLGGELGVGEQDARAHATWHNWIKIWFIESWLILCLQSESQIRVLFMNKSTSTQGHHPRFARHHDEQVMQEKERRGIADNEQAGSWELCIFTVSWFHVLFYFNHLL